MGLSLRGFCGTFLSAMTCAATMVGSIPMSTALGESKGGKEYGPDPRLLPPPHPRE